jgi:hypothetical protein
MRVVHVRGHALQGGEGGHCHLHWPQTVLQQSHSSTSCIKCTVHSTLASLTREQGRNCQVPHGGVPAGEASLVLALRHYTQTPQLAKCLKHSAPHHWRQAGCRSWQCGLPSGAALALAGVGDADSHATLGVVAKHARCTHVHHAPWCLHPRGHGGCTCHACYTAQPMLKCVLPPTVYSWHTQNQSAVDCAVACEAAPATESSRRCSRLRRPCSSAPPGADADVFRRPYGQRLRRQALAGGGRASMCNCMRMDALHGMEYSRLHSPLYKPDNAAAPPHHHSSCQAAVCGSPHGPQPPAKQPDRSCTSQGLQPFNLPPGRTRNKDGQQASRCPLPPMTSEYVLT